MKTGFVTHPIYLQHETGPGHPESPQRLKAIERHLAETGLRSKLTWIEPTPPPDLARWIAEIHSTAYYQSLQEQDRSLHGTPHARRFLYLDPDTPLSPGSLAAAEMAVSGVLTAIDRVMAGSLENAFCAVRPPGHHAEAHRAMGFCLFNNIAVGARYLQKKYGLQRVLIVDWDVHHGNGTQRSFYRDPTVFYFSTHQFPFYPGTGSESERGEGEGEGFTLNCPLPAGSGDREILHRFEKFLAPAMDSFKPEFILVSAGFDAHREDPLAGLEATEEGFGEMTQMVLSLAKTNCRGRLVSCLEGGYNLSALARSVGRHLEELMQ
ncbi:MAG TPA: histone deacetylase [Candidatus Manganitrophaceae bacterium]|nr:histone deacetylase [Candidatus Manganitrophaceae bacterium]